jgi:probable rRNA maturation factor
VSPRRSLNALEPEGGEILILKRRSPLALPGRVVRSIIRDVLRDRGIPDASLSVLFTDNRAIAKFNRKFRGVDRPTDVLAFPLEWKIEGRTPYLGDIVISAEQAVFQAETKRHAPEKELGILIIHGVLHLLGYDHEVDGGGMRRQEYRLRRKILERPGLFEPTR